MCLSRKSMKENSLCFSRQNVYDSISFILPTKTTTGKRMKITDITQPKPLQLVDDTAEGKAGMAKKAAAASRQKGDVVELSAPLDRQGTVQLEKAQAQRVASIKSRLQAGTYQVDARAVAEKMLAAHSGI